MRNVWNGFETLEDIGFTEANEENPEKTGPKGLAGFW